MYKKWKHDKNNGFREHAHRHTYTRTMKLPSVLYLLGMLWKEKKQKNSSIVSVNRCGSADRCISRNWNIVKKLIYFKLSQGTLHVEEV